MTYLEKFSRIKSLNTKHCPAGLTSRIIPFPSLSFLIPKITPALILHCCSHQLWIALPSVLNLCWKPCRWERILPSRQNVTLISCSRIVLLTKLHLLCNHPIQAWFIVVVIVVVSFFLTLGFIYTYFMLILINRYLLNIIFSMTKTLSGQNFPKQNFGSRTFQFYLQNPVSINACFLWLIPSPNEEQHSKKLRLVNDWKIISKSLSNDFRNTNLKYK